MICGSPWLSEVTCQLETGHEGSCFSKYRVLYEGDESTGEISWTDKRNLPDRCQYCGQPSAGYTCTVCRSGWPSEHCTCENNGDYCPACLAWVEERAALKEQK